MDGIIALQQARVQGDKRYARTDQHTVLPAGWDAGWKAAKIAAAGGTNTATILFNTDSVGAGQGSTDWINNGWPGKVRSALISAGSTLWADHLAAATYGVSLANQAGTMPYSPLMTGGATAEGGYGRCYIGATSQDPVSVFTLPSNATGFEIVYVDYNSGTWHYSVDGGSATVVTCTGPNTQIGATVKKTGLVAVTPGTTHALSFGLGSASNVLLIQGINVYYNTKGIGFVRNCYPGLRGVDLVTQAGSGYGAGGSASFPNDKILLMQGITAAGAATGFGFPTAPDLAFLAYGINDCDLGAPPKLFALSLRRQILAMRRAKPNCSIVVMAMSRPDGGTSSDNNAGGRGYDYQSYKRLMADIAISYGCAYIDIDGRWGPNGVALGFQNNGDIHPLDAGHADIATLVGTLI